MPKVLSDRSSMTENCIRYERPIFQRKIGQIEIRGNRIESSRRVEKVSDKFAGDLLSVHARFKYLTHAPFERAKGRRRDRASA